MITLVLVLLVAALVITLIHGGTGKVPLWPAVLLIIIVEFLQHYH